MQTGNQEKLQAAVKTISDVVEDSPNKVLTLVTYIFVLSSELSTCGFSQEKS